MPFEGGKLFCLLKAKKGKETKKTKTKQTPKK